MSNPEQFDDRGLIRCRRNLCRALAVMAGVALCSLSSAEPVTVDIKSSQKDGADSMGAVELYEKSYALVIGNDEYKKGWPRLSNAVKDARTVADALRQQGYEVALKTNLEAEQMKEAMRSFFVLKGHNPDARLLLWYAGHGETVKGEGFLVGTDTPNSDDPRFKLSAVHMRDFGSWVRLAESKHVLAIFDSCFAGTIFSSQRGTPPAAITRATTFPVRQFITSGDSDQLVLDNGAFRELFTRALDGDERADINSDGYLTASELGFFLSDRVTNLTQANQTPRYGKLRDKDYDRGDFILAVIKEQKLLADKTLSLQSAQTENLLWESARALDTVDAYQVYIDKYPRGMFINMAKMAQRSLMDKGEDAEQQPEAPPRRSIHEYDITAVNNTLYATTTLMARRQPYTDREPVAEIRKGTQLKVIGQVSGLPDAWLQIFNEGEKLFVLKSSTSVKPLKKSMSELIREKKAKYGYNTPEGVSNYQRDQCLRQCEGLSYLSPSRAQEQKMQRNCGRHIDSLQYDSCVKKARKKWRSKKLKECQDAC